MLGFLKNIVIGKKEPVVPVHMMQIRFSTPPVILEQEENEHSAIDKFTTRYGDAFEKTEHVQLHEAKADHELNRTKKTKNTVLHSLDQLSSDLFVAAT